MSFVGQPPLEPVGPELVEGWPLPDWEKIDAEPEDEIMTEIRATRRKLMEKRQTGSCAVREEPPER